MNVGRLNIVPPTALCCLTYTLNFNSNASSLAFFFLILTIFSYYCTMATLLNFLQLYCACVALMVVGVLFVSAESTLLVYFKRAPSPRSRSSNAVFQYLVERLDGSNACKRNTCSFSCEVCNSSRPFFKFTCN